MSLTSHLPRRALTVGAAALALVLASCGTGEGGSETTPAEDGDESAQDEPEAPATDQTGIEVAMQDADGQDVGTVTLTEAADGVSIEAQLTDLEPGFHGFHLHETPECDPDAPDGPFTSAEGHYAPDGNDHGEHAGDLPSLLVNEDGTAHLVVQTHAVTLDELTGADGVAIMVHADRDNFGHIPERYTSDDAAEDQASGPDQESLDTGDAGDRVACGVPEDDAGDASGGTDGTGTDDAAGEDATDEDATDTGATSGDDGAEADDPADADDATGGGTDDAAGTDDGDAENDTEADGQGDGGDAEAEADVS